MANVRYYFSNQKKSKRVINGWDIVAFVLIISVFFVIAWAAHQMAAPYSVGQPLLIHLNPRYLPDYAMRTVLRMFIALLASLLFTFTIGAWAAKSKRAERIIIPMIDILQSVPVLSFLSITIVGFIELFPDSLLGPECASIFAIFTSQAWNMTLGFYQSLRTVPHDLNEAADMFQLSAWQRFWRIEVPFSMSSLLWNTMMSMSASWFFVVMSEAISVSNQNIRLPGIGSYIAVAIDRADMYAVLYAIIAMLIVITLYDQMIFRPLIAWSEKFKFEQNPGEKTARAWLISLMQRTHILYYLNEAASGFCDFFINFRLFKRKLEAHKKTGNPRRDQLFNWLWNISLVVIISAAVTVLLRFILKSISLEEIGHVFFLGSITAIRVIALIIISSIIWIPIGVWIGMRPRVAQTVQPIIQFLAAFPANLIYPVVVLGIVHFKLNVEIWITPLMILGTQWYILFNIIAGASNLPKDLYQVADNLGVTGWQWWRRLALPAIFPYFVTGAITAAGGAWNASLVAEWVSWGSTVLRATGLGEYIHAATNAGNFPEIAVGTAMMCLFVLVLNRLVWQPLYRLAEARYSLI